MPDRIFRSVHGIRDRQHLVADAEGGGEFCRVVERHLCCKPERQHHAADALGAERIHRDRRAQRQIDAAGNPEQHARKTVLADIVAHAEHAGGVIALVAVDDRRHRSRAAPAGRCPVPDQGGDVFLERRQLRRDRKIGVQRERGAVEHQFVLAADLVEIDQRRPAFGDAGHRDRQPQIVLVARIGRAVRHHQDFGAGFGEALDDVLVVLGLFQPDVLADRHADADAADRHRARSGSAREQALFVEHAVIRQVRLVADCGDAAAVQEGAGVVEFSVIDPGAADQHRRPAIGGLARKLLDGAAACGLEGWLQHQVFRRIAGNENSGSTSKSAPSACARAVRAFAALPATSPTIGFNCASVIFNWVAGSVIP